MRLKKRPVSPKAHSNFDVEAYLESMTKDRQVVRYR